MATYVQVVFPEAFVAGELGLGGDNVLRKQCKRLGSLESRTRRISHLDGAVDGVGQGRSADHALYFASSGNYSHNAALLALQQSLSQGLQFVVYCERTVFRNRLCREWQSQARNEQDG